MTRWIAPLLLAALALAGCAGSVDASEDTVDSVDALGDTSGTEAAPGCDIDPQIADAAGEAIRLWSDAAGQPIPLPSRIELADFGDDQEHAAAWSEKLDVLFVSTLTAPEKRASSIAHELGHSFGLGHDPGTGDLMDPERPTAARLRPCVSAEVVAAAGFAGPGACVQR